jgi:branched-chain amino acid aminotransferase
MSKTASHVWMDGRLVPWDQATMHVSYECVLRGENVFEGVRAYWSEAEEQLFIFRNQEHLNRLRESAHIMRMPIPYSDAELTQASIDLISACGYRGTSVHFRPVVYFAEGEPYYYKPEDIRTGVFILAFAKADNPSLKTGVRSGISTWQRNSDLAAPSRIKAGPNYHNSRLAYVEARHNGFSVPIMLNSAGKVAEGPGACIMAVRKGKVITPPVTADILESITRDTLIELIRAELGLEVVEREIDRTELYVCEEAFFCGSGAEVLPIASIDHYPVGSGAPGALTQRIQQLYFDAVSGRLPQYRHWLTPVYPAQKTAALAAK